jgi:hypothetical protein
MRAGVLKITKGEWQAMGGLSNPSLFRKQSKNGAWRYYKIFRSFQNV